MDVVRISEPRDWSYPFAESLYKDSQVVYHGTCSAYVRDIECRGFETGGRSLPIDLLRRLINLADEANFKPWSHRVIRGISSSTRLDRPDDRAIYFAPNFWFARDYSISIGGEAMHNARLLASELLNYLETRGQRSAPPGIETEHIVMTLNRMFEGAFPIVYAVQVEPRWLQHGKNALHREIFDNFIHLEVNAACQCAVSPDCILARADYVNGAERGYQGPMPASWSEARLWGRDASTGPRSPART
jgi:hypothetical protein